MCKYHGIHQLVIPTNMTATDLGPVHNANELNECPQVRNGERNE